MASEVDEAVAKIYRHCNSSERPQAFLALFADMSDSETFWHVIARHWSSFDRIPHNDFRDLFSCHRPSWNSSHLPGDALKAFQDLSTTLTVYRGGDAETVAEGLSWTQRIDVAEAFASGHRGIKPQRPIVMAKTVELSDVAFVCVDRDEDEVVLFDFPN